MDLSFLRTLKSIKNYEENPPFKSEDIDLATFTTTYPDVIIVDQKFVHFDKASKVVVEEEEDFLVNHGPPQRPGPRIEIHTKSITTAFALVTHFAVKRGLEGGSPKTPCWTIILKEGLYIDPAFLLWSPPQMKLDNVAVEIVGMKGARILFLHKNRDASAITGFQYVTATLRNIIIHDRRDDKPLNGDTYASERMVVFNDLKASCDAKLTLKNCLLSGCILTSEVGSVVTAVDTHFIVCPMVLVHRTSKTVVQNCYIDCRVDIHHNGDGNFPLFDVYPGASLLCQKTEIRGYGKVLDAQGSGTEVTLEDNRFFVWECIGEIKENASLKVHRNYVHSPFLLTILLNVAGKIDFKENQLRVCGCTRSEFHVDQHSVKPTTDIRGVTYKHTQFNAAHFKQESKMRSAYTKSFKRQQMTKQSKGETTDFHTSNTLYKRCQGCYKPEDSEVLQRWGHGEAANPSTKFQYCARCRVVCYCSKECQMKHWPDHKLTCAMYCAVNEVGQKEDGEAEDKENLEGSQSNDDATKVGIDHANGGQGKETEKKANRGKEAKKGKGGRKRNK